MPFGGVVLRDLRAGLQDRDPVAELHGFVEVVGHEDDGLAQLLLQPQEFVLQPLPRDRVDRAERLVHQQHRRIGGQRPGDSDSLLLAARQFTRIAVAVLRRLEADQVEQFVDARGDALLVPLEQARNDRDVVADGEVGKQSGALDDVADVAAQFVRVAFASRRRRR